MCLMGILHIFVNKSGGIKFATAHDSHYMLANDYRLLAEIAAVQGQRHEQLMDLDHQKFLVSLFHEKVNEHF